MQSKKTDVVELQNEREEVIQRLQVSCPLAESVVSLFRKPANPYNDKYILTYIDHLGLFLPPNIPSDIRVIPSALTSFCFM